MSLQQLERKESHILIFNERLTTVFTENELALSSFVYNMIIDCPFDGQPIDLGHIDCIRNIDVDQDLSDFIALWKYVAAPDGPNHILTQLKMHDPETAKVTDSVIAQLVDSKPIGILCKLMIAANYFGIDPLINIYASRIARLIINR